MKLFARERFPAELGQPVVPGGIVSLRKFESRHGPTRDLGDVGGRFVDRSAAHDRSALGTTFQPGSERSSGARDRGG
jgi:hypothetical protein